MSVIEHRINGYLITERKEGGIIIEVQRGDASFVRKTSTRKSDETREYTTSELECNRAIHGLNGDQTICGQRPEFFTERSYGPLRRIRLGNDEFVDVLETDESFRNYAVPYCPRCDEGLRPDGK